MYGLLSSVRRVAPVTTLHITHNRSEAIRLADVVLLLEAGKIRRIRPEDLDQDFPSPVQLDSRHRQAAGR